MSNENWRVSGQKFKLPTAPRFQVQVRPGGWTILTSEDGTRHRLFMSEYRGQLSASLHGQLLHGLIQSERGSRFHGGPGNSIGGDSDLTSQFPGKVRKILVTEGSNVVEGDALVLVEAMKMEFTIKAPCIGTVSRILVKEGQQLSPGDRFLEILPANEAQK